MAAAGDRRLVLIFACVLVASASGLQMLPGEDPSMYLAMTRTEFWYPHGEAIVIDLGNSNSCVAGSTAFGKIDDDNDSSIFQFCIPSWVAFANNGTALVGEAAKNHATADPEAAIFGFKRLLGLRRNYWYHEDIVQGAIERVPYKIGTRNRDEPIVQVTAKDGSLKQLDLTEVASMVVAKLKAKAEEHLGRTVKYAVMTVPEHFGRGHGRLAENAARMAGLHVVGMLAEPTAIGVAYGLDLKLRELGTALVLRVGGATSDASLLVLLDGKLQVFGYLDDPLLGGDDFDRRVVDYFAKRIKMKHGVDISQDGIGLGKLRAACEDAKKALSSQDHVQLTVESLVDGVDFSEPISRSKFEELNDDLFRKVMNLVETVMVQSVMQGRKNKINEIVLVGGSAMIPKIQSLVKDYFNGREPNIMVKPDEAIALGAAIYINAP